MKCGQTPNGLPITATIRESPLGRQYYVSGISCNAGVWEATIRYIDNLEIKTLPYDTVFKK